MKKLVLITGVILIACVCAGSLMSPPVSTVAAAQQETTQSAGYVIRDSGGRIAVFRRGETAPVLVTDTLTESLPRADAKRLREGVEAEDEQALKKILEDYCS